jgi:hypothetical protein
MFAHRLQRLCNWLSHVRMARRWLARMSRTGWVGHRWLPLFWPRSIHVHWATVEHRFGMTMLWGTTPARLRREIAAYVARSLGDLPTDLRHGLTRTLDMNGRRTWQTEWYVDDRQPDADETVRSGARSPASVRPHQPGRDGPGEDESARALVSRLLMEGDQDGAIDAYFALRDGDESIARGEDDLRLAPRWWP